MPKGIVIAFVDCPDPEREEEWNRWYTHTHLPDLSVTHGLLRARRYRTHAFQSETPEVVTPPPLRYLTLYEFETEDLDAAVRSLIEQAGNTHEVGRHIDVFSMHSIHAYEEIMPESLSPLPDIDYRTATNAGD